MGWLILQLYPDDVTAAPNCDCKPDLSRNGFCFRVGASQHPHIGPYLFGLSWFAAPTTPPPTPPRPPLTLTFCNCDKTVLLLEVMHLTKVKSDLIRPLEREGGWELMHRRAALHPADARLLRCVLPGFWAAGCQIWWGLTGECKLDRSI